MLSKTLKKVFTYFDDTIIVSVQFQIDRLSIEHQREVELSTLRHEQGYNSQL
jgi:hypothetical protein